MHGRQRRDRDRHADADANADAGGDVVTVVQEEFTFCLFMPP